MFINGKLVKGAGPDSHDAVNPFNQEVLEVVPAATTDEVDQAVQAATAAIHAWSARTGAERAKVLEAIAAEIMVNKDSLAVLETKNCGKPLPESEWDIDDCAGVFTYYASLAKELDAKQDKPVDVGDKDYECTIRYEAAGVVG